MRPMAEELLKILSKEHDIPSAPNYDFIFQQITI